MKKTALVLLIQLLLLGSMIQSASAKIFVYVSNAGDGEIAILAMNPRNGDLKLLGKTPAGKMVMPLALSPDRRFLYASIRSIPYSVASYAISSETGALTHLATVPLPDDMAYISTDRTGRFLLSASYTGAKIAVNPIGLKGFVQPDPVQIMNTGPHPHSIRPDPSNRFVYVAVLGNDQFMQLVFHEPTGLLTPNKPAAVHTRKGAGPRHFDFSPNNRFVYLSNELDGTVNAYTADRETGVLREIQSISAVPRDAHLKPSTPAPGIGTGRPSDDDEFTTIRVADIHITPDGKWLYVSERTTSTIAAFAVDSFTGKFRYINSFKTETLPRNINVDPRGRFVIAAGRKSNHLAVYAINPEMGQLRLLKRYLVGKDPNWIEIVDFH